MDKNMYWVWLQRAAGKAANLQKLLEPFGGSAEALYHASPEERRALLLEDGAEISGEELEFRRPMPSTAGGVNLFGEPMEGTEAADVAGRNPYRKRTKYRPSEGTLDRLKRVSLSETEAVLELCAKENIAVLTPEDDRYPALLQEIPTFPAVLYCVGDVPLMNSTLPFAMVGAREARLTSLSAAAELAGYLAKAGLLIVSGGAMGTDSACHIGALNAGCPTVAVLGTGIGTKYLQQNADLRRVISCNGVLVSEMEPGEPGSRGSFPMRNRIIAGMSVGTLVVEAAVKSGSLITSKYAESFDRDVFAPLFPGVDPERPVAGRRASFQGTRELLERQSGLGIRCAADILQEYTGSYGVDLAEQVAEGRISVEELMRDITDLAGCPPPLLSPAMVHQARAQLGVKDLAGGALNSDPGWGPYKTRADAESRTYTAAEFAHRFGDTPHQNGLFPKEKEHVSITNATQKNASVVSSATGSSDGLLIQPIPFPNEQTSLESANTPHSQSILMQSEQSNSDDRSVSQKQSPTVQKDRSKAVAEAYKKLSSNARRVVFAFKDLNATDLYFDEIQWQLNMGVHYLLAALTELQLAGLLNIQPDTRYHLVQN